jgi:hypothetical protein
MLGAIIGAGTGRDGIPQYLLDDLIEWPRTVTWMEALASKAARAANTGEPGTATHLSITGLLLRNVGFIVLVLMHGLRRLLPPY